MPRLPHAIAAISIAQAGGGGYSARARYRCCLHRAGKPAHSKAAAKPVHSKAAAKPVHSTQSHLHDNAQHSILPL